MHILVSAAARMQIIYNLIGHIDCYYDCMIKDTYTIINYHVQYLILDAQRRFGNLK